MVLMVHIFSAGFWEGRW